MKCGGNACGKEMGGGFEQKDGSFLCAACVVHKVEMETSLDAFREIIELCDLVINGPKYSRPSKKHLEKIRLKANSVLRIRS